MKNKYFIVFSFFLIFLGCGLPEMKKLNSESKKEIDQIVKELKLEQFKYTYQNKTKNGKTKKIFLVELYEIDDSTNFEPYNDRIISAFEKSKFELKSMTVIRIAYIRNVMNADLLVRYDIDPITKKIVEVRLD